MGVSLYKGVLGRISIYQNSITNTNPLAMLMVRMVFLMAEDNVFTVQEVAIYLRMKPVTIYKHAKAGKLPCFKVGANWRFKKSTIDRWIAAQEDKENNGSK